MISAWQLMAASTEPAFPHPQRSTLISLVRVPTSSVFRSVRTAYYNLLGHHGNSCTLLAWQLMTPTLGGPINETWFSNFYDKTVQAALASSPNSYVIVDLVSHIRLALVNLI
ncbi:hypothetical protein BD309DRAFT_964422 [Dichomitus squalens]|nr:hypothetical protein BD309DRAFT_964422 [Dichomitus squalens]